VLGVLPDVSVLVVDRDLQIALTGGPPLLIPDPTATAHLGRPAADVVPPSAWTRLEPLLRAALAGERGSAEIDFPVEPQPDPQGRPSTSSRALHVDAEPVTDRDGTRVGAACFIRELEGHTQLAEELDWLRRLLDLAHDAIIVREPESSAITYWNREAEDLYGYTAAEARGRSTHELLQTVFPESLEAADDELQATGRWDGDLQHVRKDGTAIAVSSRQALVRDERGEPSAVIELNSDISERRHAERALREAEQQFRGLVESAPDAMVIVDENGTIVLINAQAEELFGYARPELIGQNVEVLLPRALRRRHVGHRAGFLAHPEARPMGAGLDLLARRKDGSEFVAEISLSPLETESGLLISTSIRDISKQMLRQLEQALVPRMRIDERWRVAWRYRPSINTMLLGGDFIGVAERADRSLSLLIGDVTGHGPSAAGTGAMLRAAWLGAVQADVAMEELPEMLHRLLTNQADSGATTLATLCLAEVDDGRRWLKLIRAGHDSPLLITPGGVDPLGADHGPAIGLRGMNVWPVQRIRLPPEGAIMLFTDGLTERRAPARSSRLGFAELLPRLRPETFLNQPPGQAIDEMLRDIFPQGTGQLDDDLAVIVLGLGAAAAAAQPSRERMAS
jgi:PAS domain S-box-containing protein